MSDAGSEAGHVSVERYLEMAECGVFSPDDRVELLDGLIVAMAPPTPSHDDAVQRVQYALLRKLGLEVVTRVQSSYLAGDKSVPQPDRWKARYDVATRASGPDPLVIDAFPDVTFEAGELLPPFGDDPDEDL